jgi:CBS domain-containing protein
MAETVRDIMEADVPRIAPSDSVETVLNVMREHELPGVPVTNDAGRCVGIITDADLVLSEDGSDLHLPHYVELFGGVVFLEPLRRFEERLRKAFSSTAADLMTADPVTIGPDATVHEAARVISDRGHNRLPVVEHGRLVGVVTRLDVLAALTRDEG